MGSVVGVLALGGIVVMGLIRLDYEAKPEVLNALGLNPVVAWKGKQAPGFRLRNMRTGQPTALSSYRGKVVLLDFWASWCGPCRKQLPILQRLHTDATLRDKIQIVTINMKETAPSAAVMAYVRREGFTFPVLKGTPEVVTTYKVWFFPAMVLLSPKGKVVYTGAEFHTEAKIRAQIQQALVPNE